MSKLFYFNIAENLCRTEIAHNMYLIAIQVHESARIGTPIGFDIKLNIGGNLITFINLYFFLKYKVFYN